MKNTDERDQQIEALRNRLSRLSEASLRINESLDLDTVLQEILDSARSLTDARYGVIVTLDDKGQVEDFLASGLTDEETQQVLAMPEGLKIFEYLTTIPGPLRGPDFVSYIRSQDLPEFRLPTQTSAYLGVPIRHRGENVGNIYLAKSEPGQEFTREDEETLVMFASQAGAGHRQRPQVPRRAAGPSRPGNADQHLAGGRGGLRRPNRRVGVHQPGGQKDYGGAYRRRDAPWSKSSTCSPSGVRMGARFLWPSSPLAQALSNRRDRPRRGDRPSRAPTARSVTTLVNATPIRSEDGEVESVVVTLQDMTPLEELERLRAELLGTVSHELRVPLTSIRGSATTLLNPSSDLDPRRTAPVLPDYRRSGRPHGRADW